MFEREAFFFAGEERGGSLSRTSDRRSDIASKKKDHAQVAEFMG